MARAQIPGTGCVCWQRKKLLFLSRCSIGHWSRPSIFSQFWWYPCQSYFLHLPYFIIFLKSLFPLRCPWALVKIFSIHQEKKISGLKEKTEHLGRLYEYGNHIFWVQKWNFYYLLLSRVQLFVTPWIVAHQASLSITISWSLLKLMSIELVMLSNQLILCRPLLLPPSIFPSIRVFSHESVPHIRWSKYWSFSFSISPSNEYSGLISFRIDWFNLLAVEGTLKNLQHNSLKASVLQCLVFFVVQLSHPYMTTGKTIGLTRWTFVSKIMSLLFTV